MELAVLAQIGAVCVLGAMSPGPSLAVVLRNTVAGGRLRGVMTGLGHGIGFFFYALIAVSGLAAAMDAGDAAARALQWGGATVLVWLGWQFLHSDGVVADEHDSGGREGFVAGFLVAFLNPKILAFFVAVFSQFIEPGLPPGDRLAVALLAGTIDASWYMFVATAIAGTPLLDALRRHAQGIDRAVGSVLLLLAGALLLSPA